MKKTSLLFIAFLLVSPSCKASIEGNYNAGLLNSQHMKEFNIFERGVKLPQILSDLAKPKSYYINTVSFEKNIAFTSEKLTEIISDEIGTKLTPDVISSMKENIVQFYQINGYKSAIVNVSDKQATQGVLLFTIYEGPKNRIETIPEP